MAKFKLTLNEHCVHCGYTAEFHKINFSCPKPGDDPQLDRVTSPLAAPYSASSPDHDQGPGPEKKAATTAATHDTQNKLEAIVNERAKTYGDFQVTHRALGLAWTAAIENHYQIKLDHPIPPELAAMIMSLMKSVRACGQPFLQDTYDDLNNYTKFAEQMHKEK